jgi:predicted nucleic acid-binding protein
VRFWDASALTPIVVSEPSSAVLEAALAADAAVVAWWASRVECVSALRRREREGILDGAGIRQALAVLEILAGEWAEVAPAPRVRAEAERALAVHPLRAADALQLAAATVWRDDSGVPHEFVCLDERLRDAASREGFALVPDDEDYAGIAPR